MLALGAPIFPAELVAEGRISLPTPQSAEVAMLERLPGTSVEVETLQELHGERVIGLTRELATEKNFRKHLKTAEVIHLGTHGLVDQRQSLFSSLVFSVPSTTSGNETEKKELSRDETIPAGTPDDGFLQAFEIFNLDLNTELVVLSSCSTGVGELHDGEGVMSLGRAFTVAGARSQLLTFWNVNDASSAALVTEFYRALFTEKKSKAEALRQAKLAMFHDYDIKNGAMRGTVRQHKKNAPAPARLANTANEQAFLAAQFWTGFVLIGDWR